MVETHDLSTGRPMVSPQEYRRILAVVLLAVVVVGSVGFARYDWSGFPLDRHPASQTQEYAPGCTEELGSYVTESGRVVESLGNDDVQYLSMVRMFRGEPRSELAADCLYSPYTYRPGTPWLAAQLPFEEGLSLGIVNLAFTLVAATLVVATTRRLGVGARALLASGLLFAVNWNLLVFSSGLLVEAAPVAVVAGCWYLMVRRRWLPILLLVAVGLFFKESVAIVVPALLAHAWSRRADGEPRSDWLPEAAVGLVGAVLVLVRLTTWGSVTPSADAPFPADPSLGIITNNLDPVGLAVLAVAAGPLLVPAFLWWRSRVRSSGLARATIDPIVVGVLASIVLTLSTALAADLSPRHLWPAFPFAASATGLWLSSGRPAAVLGRVPLPSWLPAGEPAAASG